MGLDHSVAVSNDKTWPSDRVMRIPYFLCSLNYSFVVQYPYHVIQSVEFRPSTSVKQIIYSAADCWNSTSFLGCHLCISNYIVTRI